jgi:hypothetical protein
LSIKRIFSLKYVFYLQLDNFTAISDHLVLVDDHHTSWGWSVDSELLLVLRDLLDGRFSVDAGLLNWRVLNNNLLWLGWLGNKVGLLLETATALVLFPSAGCSWCDAGAVKPACNALSNAKLLPPAVFTCDPLPGV